MPQIDVEAPARRQLSLVGAAARPASTACRMRADARVRAATYVLQYAGYQCIGSQRRFPGSRTSCRRVAAVWPVESAVKSAALLTGRGQLRRRVHFQAHRWPQASGRRRGASEKLERSRFRQFWARAENGSVARTGSRWSVSAAASGEHCDVVPPNVRAQGPGP